MSKIAARNPDLIREQLEADFDTIQREHKRKDLAQRQFMLKTFNDCASEFGDRLFGVDGSTGQDLSNYLMEKSNDEMTKLMI